MKILHVCAGWQQWNGAANIARMIMDEQERTGHEVASRTWASIRELRAADEVWIHCGWLPCLWWTAVVCFLTQRRRGAEKKRGFQKDQSCEIMRDLKPYGSIHSLHLCASALKNTIGN